MVLLLLYYEHLIPQWQILPNRQHCCLRHIFSIARFTFCCMKSSKTSLLCLYSCVRTCSIRIKSIFYHSVSREVEMLWFERKLCGTPIAYVYLTYCIKVWFRHGAMLRSYTYNIPIFFLVIYGGVTLDVTRIQNSKLWDKHRENAVNVFSHCLRWDIAAIKFFFAARRGLLALLFKKKARQYDDKGAYLWLA